MVITKKNKHSGHGKPRLSRTTVTIVADRVNAIRHLENSPYIAVSAVETFHAEQAENRVQIMMTLDQARLLAEVILEEAGEQPLKTV